MGAVRPVDRSGTAPRAKLHEGLYVPDAREIHIQLILEPRDRALAVAAEIILMAVSATRQDVGRVSEEYAK